LHILRDKIGKQAEHCEKHSALPLKLETFNRVPSSSLCPVRQHCELAVALLIIYHFRSCHMFSTCIFHVFCRHF